MNMRLFRMKSRISALRDLIFCKNTVERYYNTYGGYAWGDGCD